MKILYIAHRIPYPPNKGDKIRSFNEIKYLSQKHEIHLTCLADDPKDLKYEEELKKYCKAVRVVLINPQLAKLKSIFYLLTKRPLTIPYFYSSKLQQTVDQLLSTDDYDAIFCFSSPMAEYVFRSRLLVSSFLQLDNTGNQQPAARNQKSVTRNERLETSDQQPETSNRKPASSNQQPRLIMDFVDVDSDKWAQYSKYARFPMSWIYALEGRRLADYERYAAENFDHSIFVTEAEGKIFKGKHPHVRNISIISNGVDLDYFSPNYLHKESAIDQRPSANERGSSTINQHPATSKLQPPETSNKQQAPSTQPPESSNQQPIIVFTGAMDYYANIDGVVWFAKEILPLIKKEIPEIQFFIVGSNPTKEVLSLSSNNGVTVTGYVPDTREYLSAATVVVVPLRIARGIQNKILEAMAMGLPVVATPQAFEGIDARPKRDLILEENTEKFGESVVQLIRNIYLRKCLGDNARKAVEDNYSWVKNLGKLDQVMSP